jgi:hypothetical protein
MPPPQAIFFIRLRAVGTAKTTQYRIKKSVCAREDP